MTSFLASMLMKRIGRRAGFSVGAGIGIVGALLAAVAVSIESLALLTLATFIFGTYNAFGAMYRFAAADSATGDFKAKAISYVLAGGLVGGLIGPAVSTASIDLFAQRFVGAYLVLVVFMLLAVLILRKLDIPPPSEKEMKDPGRPLMVIMRQPKFIVAVVAGALSYMVMNLLMTATPLEMTTVCGHPFGAAAFVIGSHVIGMFAPSFVTGSLIKRFGLMNVMFAGVVLLFVTAAIALAGITIAHFWFALVTLGVGWNFLYIGATALLTETYQPAERSKAQGANDSLIFFTMMASSFGSGFLLNKNGWEMLNYVSIAIAVIIAAAVLWGMTLNRVAPAAAAAR